MNSLNSILIEGNIVADCSIKVTPNGSSVCNFTIATNRYSKADDGFNKETSFFDIECWGRLAESCNTLGNKGRGIRVVGRLKQNRWNGEDGKPRSKIIIVGEHVEFKPIFNSDKADEQEKDLGKEDEVSKDDIPF